MKRIMVYPRKAATDFFGTKSTKLNYCLEVFAFLIKKAIRENESLFSRNEWELLADAMEGLAVDKIDPTIDPVLILRGYCGDISVKITDTISHLEFINAQALIYSLTLMNSEQRKQYGDWWTLAERLNFMKEHNNGTI